MDDLGGCFLLEVMMKYRCFWFLTNLGHLQIHQPEFLKGSLDYLFKDELRSLFAQNNCQSFLGWPVDSGFSLLLWSALHFFVCVFPIIKIRLNLGHTLLFLIRWFTPKTFKNTASLHVSIDRHISINMYICIHIHILFHQPRTGLNEGSVLFKQLFWRQSISWWWQVLWWQGSNHQHLGGNHLKTSLPIPPGQLPCDSRRSLVLSPSRFASSLIIIKFASFDLTPPVIRLMLPVPPDGWFVYNNGTV